VTKKLSNSGGVSILVRLILQQKNSHFSHRGMSDMGYKDLTRIVSIAAAAFAVTAPVAANAQQKYTFDIPAQDLGAALRQFAQTSRQQVTFNGALVRGKTTAGLNGSYTVDRGLSKLLRGTGLGVRKADRGVFVLTRLQASASAAFQPVTTEGTEAGSNEPVDAPVDIVVTAQKRSERLRDVPLPVTVLNTSLLAQTNQLRVQDYFSKIPGVSYQAGGLEGQESQAIIVIRGISTGGVGNAVVGNVIDDVPFGASASPSFAAVVPDIDPGDLERIEVLRGPQGTLYGASSMGGLLKFVTIDPSVEEVSGRIQTGLNTVRTGETGYSLRGSLNVPISDTLAVRASGFRLRDPGYIDNPLTGKNDVNRRDGKGGRAALLWQPSSDFSVRLSGLIQESFTAGSDVANLALGTRNDLQLSGIPGVNIYKQRIENYSAIATGNIGNIELKSITGSSYLKVVSAPDYTAPFLGGFFSDLATTFFGVSGVAVYGANTAKRFSQEVRASIPLQIFNLESTWLVGAMYNNEKADDSSDFQAVDPDNGEIVGTLLTNGLPSKYKETAFFSNLNLQITDQFDIQFGGRLAYIRQEGASVSRVGPLVRIFFDPNSDTFQTPTLKAKDNPFTYLISPRYKISPDVMVYARLASGYRPGGPNSNCGVMGVPCQYSHDTTTNYEVGTKGKVLDGALSFDLSIYRIDWSDIQLGLTVPTTVLGYTANAGTARSEGVELSLEGRPLPGLTLSGWVAYNDARLVKALPETAGDLANLPEGSRLPMSSRWSGSISFNHDFDVGQDVRARVGGSASYVDDRIGGLALAPLVYPSYVQADISAGIEYRTFRLDVYVNNVTDKRASLSGDPVSSSLVTYSRPRTLGFTVTKSF